MGCEGAAEVVDPGTGTDERPAAPSKAGNEKTDHWNYTNDPARLNMQLEYTLDKLPREGRAERIPWPDTYWPTYQDSINVRWQGRETLSPAEKYDLAFNGWEKPEGWEKLKPYSSDNCEDKSWSKEYYEKLGPAASYVSANKGNADARNGLDDDNDGKTDECDDRDGVESWWGLCHAWVPAALLEQEPKRAVTHNGVTFDVSDLKALLIMQYDRSQAVMVGGRCNDKEVKRDEKTGRILDEQCRDTNAGTWHVVMANLLGIHKRALAEDRTYNYEVWNQPVLEWEVTSMEEVDFPKVKELLQLPAEDTTYKYNPEAVKWFEVKATSHYITESHASTEPYTDVISTYTRQDYYHYVLEIDKNGKIHGGEWIGESNQNHPDFLWLPTASRGGNPHIDLEQVRLLVERSQKPEDEEAPTADLIVHGNTNPFEIPDNDTTGINSTIDVPDAFAVKGLDVEVDIAHTYVGDLKVVLKKGDKSVTLHDNAGGNTDNIKRTFKLTDFDGVDANGTWELLVTDNAQSDKGTLKSWKLKFHSAGGTPAAGGTITAASTGETRITEAQPGTSVIKVADGQQIRGVRVTVDLDYSYVGDLTIELTHGAVKSTLSAGEGGGATSLQKTFDVTGFNGLESDGDWTLTVTDGDTTNGDEGTLKSWKLDIQH